MGTGIPSREQSGRSVTLTSHLYLVPKLRMSGGIPPIPLYVFMAWTEIFTFLHISEFH
jgi:hypothetical protein